MLRAKKIFLAIWIVVLLIFAFRMFSWAQCPEAPNDNGICDTMYVEVFPSDALRPGSGHLVRVPIYVTHDIPNPNLDSICGFVIPLWYTHTNPSKYCSLSGWWNNTDLYPSANIDRSIFRHLPGYTNWMMALSERLDGSEWDFRFLDLDGTSHFWFSSVPSGVQDQRFCEGRRILLATMTFMVEDTMTVCIDSCLWPPNNHLRFSNIAAYNYVPRHFMPYCFSIYYPAVGDANADGIINVGDIVYLVSYLYRGGPAPDPLWVGDCNCDGIINVGDVVYLVSYLYRGGPPPCEP